MSQEALLVRSRVTSRFSDGHAAPRADRARRGEGARRWAAGFTLFELLMVMAVVGIIVGIAVPSFKYVTASNRVSFEINTLVGDLQFARAEAIKEGQFVTVCPSANPSATNPSCATGGTWETGWIVFVDANGNQTYNSANDRVLRQRLGFSLSGSTDTLRPTSALAAIMFNREGYAATGATTTVNLQLHTVPTVNNWTRCLQVTPIGGLSVVRYGFGSVVTCS